MVTQIFHTSQQPVKTKSQKTQNVENKSKKDKLLKRMRFLGPIFKVLRDMFRYLLNSYNASFLGKKRIISILTLLGVSVNVFQKMPSARYLRGKLARVMASISIFLAGASLYRVSDPMKLITKSPESKILARVLDKYPEMAMMQYEPSLLLSSGYISWLWGQTFTV